MLRYVARRLLFALVALAVVSVVTFGAMRLSGDVTFLLVGLDATADEIAAVRARYGLDQTLLQQYVTYAERVLHGDFGTSIKYGVPALDLVLSRLPHTILLALVGLGLALAIGIPLGIRAAVRRGSAADHGATAVALVGQAMPGFWVGTMLQLVFAVSLGWLPTGGSGTLAHLVLPAVTVSWFTMAAFVRLTRSSMLDVLHADYVKLARLKGNPERTVIARHAFRNAAVPLVTFAGVNLGALLGGAVVVESVFAWPGVGQLMVAAIGARDYPVVQAGVVVSAAMFLLVNFVVDLLYGVLDPRIRHGER